MKSITLVNEDVNATKDKIVLLHEEWEPHHIGLRLRAGDLALLPESARTIP